MENITKTRPRKIDWSPFGRLIQGDWRAYRFLLFLLAAASFCGASSVWAANATWTGGTDGTWATTTNWNLSLVPGLGNTATFNGTGNGNTGITVGTISLSNITFDTVNAASYTLGATPGTGTITFADGTTTAITRNGTVTANEIINANLTLGTAVASTTTFTNNSTTGLLTLGGSIAGGSGGTAAAKTVIISGAGNTTVGGIISNGGATSVALTKSGAGMLTLNAANTYAGNTTVTAGTLALDFSAAGAPATNIIAAGTAQTNGSLILGNVSVAAGGATTQALSLIGNANAGNSQTFAGISLFVGASHMNLTPGTGTGSMVVRLGHNNRVTGSELDISLPANTSATTTDVNLLVRNSVNSLVSSGIVNGFTTVNGNTWAVSGATALASISSTSGNSTFTVASGAPADGSQIVFTTAPTGLTVTSTTYYVLNGTGNATSFQVAATPGGTAINATSTTTCAITTEGSLTGLASYVTNWSNNTTASSGANIDVTASGNLGNTIYNGPSSIRFNTAAMTTVTLSANTLTQIQSGGILVTSNVANNLSKITGGIIQGINRRDLSFIQNNTSNILEIDSIIADQGGSQGGVTKSGAGTLLLTGNNTFGGSAGSGGSSGVSCGSVVNEGTLIVAGDVVAGANKTASINAGSTTLSMADTTGIFIGEEVANNAGLLGAGVNASFIVRSISTNVSVTLSQSSNATITGGTFVFGGAGGLGVGASAAVSIAPGATLQIGNGGTTGSLVPVAAIFDNGTLAFNKTNTLTQGTDFSTAAISGVGSVAQNGSGSTVFNVSNTYTGETYVNAGSIILAVGGSINTSSKITVASAATFTNNSATAVSTVLALNKGATLNGTGAFAPTSMTITADLTGGPAGGLISLSSALTETGRLVMTLTGITPGPYSLFSGGTLSGSFGALTVNGNVFGGLSGSDGTFSYSFDGTNTLTIGGTPEPSTWSLLALGLATVVVAVRRRRDEGR